MNVEDLPAEISDEDFQTLFLRESKGLTADFLSSRLHISIPTIRRYADGTSRPYRMVRRHILCAIRAFREAAESYKRHPNG